MTSILRNPARDKIAPPSTPSLPPCSRSKPLVYHWHGYNNKCNQEDSRKNSLSRRREQNHPSACQVQPYGYGKKGSKSLAARLALATPENNFKVNEEQTYGEVRLSYYAAAVFGVYMLMVVVVDGRSPERTLPLSAFRNRLEHTNQVLPGNVSGRPGPAKIQRRSTTLSFQDIEFRQGFALTIAP